MTRERISELKAQLAATVKRHNPDRVEIDVPDADALLAAAEEALELREALEWLAGPEVISLRLYHPTKLDPKFEAYVSMQLAGGIIGVGATPLEAIQNARRRK